MWMGSRFPVKRWKKWYQDDGEPYIHQKAFLCGCPSVSLCTVCERDGYIYENQYNIVVDGQQYTGYGRFHDAADNVDEKEFGIITGGTIEAKTFPDECMLARPDRIILPLRNSVIARHKVTRGESAIDGLTYPFLHAINYVRQGATVYRNYRETAQGIQWLVGDKPEAGSEYAIEYVYAPVYVALDSIRSSRPGKGGELMPQRSRLDRWIPEHVNQMEG